MLNKSCFEYYYSAGHVPETKASGVCHKTLVISFASRSAIRHAVDEPTSKQAEFFGTLSSANVDALFVRPAYEGFPGDAYINEDYQRLTDYIVGQRQRRHITRMITLGYCFGCAAAYKIASLGAADETLLLSPSLSMPSTLRAIDDPDWVKAFDRHTRGLSLPPLTPFPQTVPLTIMYGSNYQKLWYRDKDVAEMLRRHVPHADVIEVEGAEHQLPQYWKRGAELVVRLCERLRVEPKTSPAVPDAAEIRWQPLTAGACTHH